MIPLPFLAFLPCLNCHPLSSQVAVEWTEMPGSKIRATSILSMAFELLTVKASWHGAAWRAAWPPLPPPDLLFGA